MKTVAMMMGMALGAWCGNALAAPPVDESYVKSLAAPGKTVLVIEYFDGKGAVSQRKGFVSASGYKAISGTEIQVDDRIALRLYGIQACDGEMVNRAEGFSGTCSDFAKEQLQVMLKSPRVLFCRAFVTEMNAQTQDATCYGYYNYPGALDSVDQLEEQLVSNGAARLIRKSDGSAERPDLQEAERIGKDGSYGMWADERIKGE